MHFMWLPWQQGLQVCTLLSRAVCCQLLCELKSALNSCCNSMQAVGDRVADVAPYGCIMCCSAVCGDELCTCTVWCASLCVVLLEGSNVS
jgi:hypothetical protein